MKGDQLIKNAGDGWIVPLADRYESGPHTSSVVDMRDAHGCMFVLVEGAGGTGTVTITVEKCDSSGTTNTAIAFHVQETTAGSTPGALTAVASTGHATTAGANKIICIFVDAKALGSLGYWQLVLTELVDAACLAGVICFKFPAYA